MKLMDPTSPLFNRVLRPVPSEILGWIPVKSPFWLPGSALDRRIRRKPLVSPTAARQDRLQSIMFWDLTIKRIKRGNFMVNIWWWEKTRIKWIDMIFIDFWDLTTWGFHHVWMWILPGKRKTPIGIEQTTYVTFLLSKKVGFEFEQHNMMKH